LPELSLNIQLSSFNLLTTDPKLYGQVMCSSMRTKGIKSQNLEIQGKWSRGVFPKVLGTSLDPQGKVFSTHFRYKIKRKGGEFDKFGVRLVKQCKHMKRQIADGAGDHETVFSPVQSASGFWSILSLATQFDTLTDHVEISQTLVQGELLPGDGHNSHVYISAQPGYEEDPINMYRLLKPLCGMPSAARVWHTNINAFLQREAGCETIGFQKSI